MNIYLNCANQNVWQENYAEIYETNLIFDSNCGGCAACVVAAAEQKKTKHSSGFKDTRLGRQIAAEIYHVRVTYVVIWYASLAFSSKIPLKNTHRPNHSRFQVSGKMLQYNLNYTLLKMIKNIK